MSVPHVPFAPYLAVISACFDLKQITMKVSPHPPAPPLHVKVEKKHSRRHHDKAWVETRTDSRTSHVLEMYVQ